MQRDPASISLSTLNVVCVTMVLMVRIITMVEVKRDNEYRTV